MQFDSKLKVSKIVKSKLAISKQLTIRDNVTIKK